MEVRVKAARLGAVQLVDSIGEPVVIGKAAGREQQLFAAGPGRPAASDRVTLLLGLAAVWHDDLRLAETLRRIARLQVGDWALRAAAIAVARRQGYQLLLHELWAGETDPELHAELTTVLTGEPASGAEETVA